MPGPNQPKPPGQGTSKKARQRRNRRNRGTKQYSNPNTRNTTNYPTSIPVEPRVRNRRRRRNQVEGGNGYPIYLDSLRNPDIPGAKIPDLTAVPTGTFQLTYDTTLTPTADGVYALAFQPGATTGSLWLTSSSTSNTVTYAAVTGLPGQTAAQGLYTHTRVVSGYIDVEFVGNTTADKGQLCGYLFKSTATNTGSATTLGLPTQFGAATALGYSETFPVRNGMRILYRPMDNSDLEFQVSTITANFGYPGIIGFFAYGLDPSASIRARIVANYEGISKADTTNIISASPSPINVTALGRALEWGQTLTDKIVPLFGGWSGVQQAATSLAYAYYATRQTSRRYRIPQIAPAA